MQTACAVWGIFCCLKREKLVLPDYKQDRQDTFFPEIKEKKKQ